MFHPVLRHDLLLVDMRTALLEAVFVEYAIPTDVYSDYLVGEPIQQSNGDVAVFIQPPENNTDGIEVVYRRICASTITNDRALVLNADIDFGLLPTAEQVKEAVEERYGIVLNNGHFTLDNVEAFDYPDFYRGEIVFSGDHLTLEGKLKFQIVPQVLINNVSIDKRIAMMDHYKEYYNDPRLPAEIMFRESELQVESSVLSNPDLDLETIAKVLSQQTKDEWVIVDHYADFNLYDATIVYNGVAQDRDLCSSEWGHVLVLELGPYAANLKGQLTIYYREPARKAPVKVNP